MSRRILRAGSEAPLQGGTSAAHGKCEPSSAAVAPTPPLTVESSPLAVLSRPPLTAAPRTLATLSRPPATTDADPSARFLNPPTTAASVVARFEPPPQTVPNALAWLPTPPQTTAPGPSTRFSVPPKFLHSGSCSSAKGYSVGSDVTRPKSQPRARALPAIAAGDAQPPRVRRATAAEALAESMSPNHVRCLVDDPRSHLGLGHNTRRGGRRRSERDGDVAAGTAARRPHAWCDTVEVGRMAAESEP